MFSILLNKIQIEQMILMARVADQSERYADMVDFLEIVLDAKTEDLSSEERNLLSVGLKNLISSNRSAWRIITALKSICFFSLEYFLFLSNIRKFLLMTEQI